PTASPPLPYTTLFRSGLLHVAAAALALHRRARPGEPAGAWTTDGERQARVEVDALFGERAVVTLREDPQTPEGTIDLAGLVAQRSEEHTSELQSRENL